MLWEVMVLLVLLVDRYGENFGPIWGKSRGPILAEITVADLCSVLMVAKSVEVVLGVWWVRMQ